MSNLECEYFQGYSLCTSDAQPEMWQYGIATIAINWLPGLAAAVHIVSMYRTQLSAKTTLLCAGNCSISQSLIPNFWFILERNY